jgi:hypothetical protein
MKYAFILINSYKYFIFLFVFSQLLAGCTSMVARTNITPYTKDKIKRNEIEYIAEKYCNIKRELSNENTTDYIFTTDGCSRWPDSNWKACCVLHDISYWCGGSYKDRQDSDHALRICVNKKNNGVGSIMYPGVRLGGSPWLPTPWRWGYGWDDWPREYEKLENSPSINQLMKELDALNIIESHM